MNKIIQIALFLVACSMLKAQSTNMISFPDANSSAQIGVDTSNNLVTFTLTGPSDRFFALAYGSFTIGMLAGNDIMWVIGGPGSASVVDGQTAGFTVPSTDGTNNLTLVSATENSPSAGLRTVVVTRPLDTGDTNDFTFSAGDSTIDLAMVQAGSATYVLGPHGGGVNADRSLDVAYSAPLNVNDSDDVEFTTSVYPNPVLTEFLIQTSGNITDVSIYSATGQLIKVESVQDSYDISALDAGIYFVEITFDDGKTVFKKIIKN